MRTVIYGNGAMARVLYSYLRHDREVAGFTVDDACCATAAFCGRPLVPFSRLESDFPPSRHELITAIGFREMNALRLRKAAEARARGYALGRYVHGSVLRHDGVEIAENCIVLDHSSIHPGSRLGPGCFLSSNVNLGHDCVLGEGCWLNAGVALAGGCELGPACFLGVNACLAQGVRLGARCFVGAATLVHRATGEDEVHLAPAGEKLRLRSADFLTFSRMG